MRFAGFGILTSIMLLALASSALAAMHLLRSRPSRVRVVTTLFWESAKSAVRPRSFRHRFQQWLAFLILLSIAALSILSASRIVLSSSSGEARHVVLVLDAGMSMQAASASSGRRRFDDAVEAARAVLAGMRPTDRLSLIVVDPQPRLLHRFDQPLAAARTLLSGLKPSDEPADSTAATQLARSLLAGRAGATLVHITDRAASPTPSIAGRTEVAYVSIGVGETCANAAILSTLFIPDSANATRGTLLVRVGWWGEGNRESTVRAASGTTGELLINERITIQSNEIAEVSSLPMYADGRTVNIELSEPEGTPADNRLEVRLPVREQITVAADMTLPPALSLALRSGFARLVSADESDASIRVVFSSTASEDRQDPLIVLVDEGDPVTNGSHVDIADDSRLTQNLNLENAVCGSGPALDDWIDDERISPLIEAQGRVLAAIDEGRSGASRLLLSSALFSPGSNVPNRPAFPLLLSRALHRLAGWDDPFVPIPVERVWKDPLWANAIDEHQDSVLIPAGRALSDLRKVTPSFPGEMPLPSTRGLSASQFMLLFALLLIALEAVLHARGRIT